MSVPVVSVRLDTRKLDEIAAGLNKNTDQVLGWLAKEVELEAKRIVIYDTHALQNSIEAIKKGELLYWTQDGVTYGIHIEFPGITRKWKGAPFMVPAAEKVGHDLNSGKTWERLFK